MSKEPVKAWMRRSAWKIAVLFLLGLSSGGGAAWCTGCRAINGLGRDIAAGTARYEHD